MDDLMKEVYRNNDYSYKRPNNEPKDTKDYDNDGYKPNLVKEEPKGGY